MSGVGFPFSAAIDVMSRFLPILTLLIVVASGCAEGPFWRMGRYNPWVLKRWREEEKFATSLDAKRQSIRALGKAAADLDRLDSEQSVAELAEILREDNTPLARIEAARALGMSRHPRAVAALGVGLTDAEAEVRIAICSALGELEDPAAINVLARTLGQDTDADVRLAATRALGRYRDPAAVRALAVALDDRSPALQYRAMESLRTASGQNFGADLERWQAYAKSENPTIESRSQLAGWWEDVWR